MQTIFVTGVPRSGTTWISRALAAATGSQLVHEPFNWRLQRDQSRVRYSMRYIPSGRADPAFVAVLRAAIAKAPRMRALSRRGRFVLKDVHACLAVEAVHEALDPLTVIVVRHPCAVAASWTQLGYGVANILETLLDQDELMRAHLDPFATHMRRSGDYLFRLGAYWGAAYYTIDRLAERHPEWRVITHEAVCREPVAELGGLLSGAGLEMASKGRRFLVAHDRHDGAERPYSVDRATVEEPDKWRARLGEQEIARVIEGARPFGVLERFYPAA